MFPNADVMVKTTPKICLDDFFFFKKERVRQTSILGNVLLVEDTIAFHKQWTD